MKKLFSKFLLFIAVAIATPSMASAADFDFDNGTVTLGKVYEIANFASVSGQLTPSVSGTLIQDGVSDLNLEGLDFKYEGYGSYGQVKTWQVEAGKTYIVSCDFVFSGGKVCFSMAGETEIKLVMADPAVNTEYSIAINGGEIVLKFNKPVVYTGVELTCARQTASFPGSADSGVLISVNPYDDVLAWYNAGIITGGETMNLTVSGLADSDGRLYNGDGVLRVAYKAAKKAVMLQNINVDSSSKFLSYFTASNPAGKLTFTFTGNLAATDVVATLTSGDSANEDTYYYEAFNASNGLTVSGNTITVDLSGRLRDLRACLLPGYEDIWATVSVQNIRDEQGNPCLSNVAGGYGSVLVSLPYEYIEPVTVASEFIPANGTSLAGHDKVEIWFNNSDKFTFQGVAFDYIGGNVNIPVDQLDIARDGSDTTILVDIPAEVKGRDCVTVYLYGVEGLDGYPHEIKAEYDTFVVALVSPILPGQAIASTGDEDFVFTVNTDYPYIRYDFFNAKGAEGWAYGTQLNKQDDGTYTAYNGNYICYNDFTPYMLVSAFNDESDYYGGAHAAATYRFDFVGATPAFAYSSHSLISITPEDESEITPTDDFCFELTFDGLVTFDPVRTGIVAGFGGGLLEFEKAEAIGTTDEDPEGFASVWRLYPGETYLRSHESIAIAVAAKDLEGLYVKGNMGDKETTHFSFWYEVYNAADDVLLTVNPADGEVVSTIDVVEVSAEGFTLVRNYNVVEMPTFTVVSGNTADLKAEDGWNDNVYTLTDDEIVFDGTVARLVLAKPFTAPNRYDLYIPAGFFDAVTDNGEGVADDVARCGAVTASITIKTDGVELIAPDKADAYIVYTLAGVRVMVTADNADLRLLPAGIYIVNGKKLLLN